MSTYTEVTCVCCGALTMWPKGGLKKTHPRCGYCRAWCLARYGAARSYQHHGVPLGIQQRPVEGHEAR